MFENIALAITGLGALIAAIAGVLLVVHQVRGKERKAADLEIDELSQMLDKSRRETLEAKRREYEIRRYLADRGMEYPE